MMLPFYELLDTKEEKNKLHILYQAFERQLYHVAYATLKNAAQAEDMVQETFFRVMDHLGAIDEETYQTLDTYLQHYEKTMTLTEYIKIMEKQSCGKAWGYLVTTLNHGIYLSYRQQKRENRIDETLTLLYEEKSEKKTVNPESILEKEERIDAVKQELSHLPYPYKETLSLKYGEKLSAAQIGAIFGKTEENIRQILSRGRKMLKIKLEKRGIL